MTTFSETFKAATGFDPYPYQVELATRPNLPALVSVPTGCGKTAAVILGWLWRRRLADKGARRKTPRRLVYCLPMRVLVEQTRDCAVTWLQRLGQLGGEAQFEKGENGTERLADYDPWAGADDPEKIRVHLLMGGDVDRDWDMYPERDAILIGTQDMLLSRALNRGYAMSRFRWPVHFGLLNNDCLWVFDEVQLLGNGLATSIQLDAFRSALWPTARPCMSCWMSATTSPEAFGTTDRKELCVKAPESYGLTEKDHHDKRLASRLSAEKDLELLARPPKLISRERTGVLDLHQARRMTLIVVNTVNSALQWHADLKAELDKKHGSKRKPATLIPALILLHSRFRLVERRQQMKQLEDFLKRIHGTGAAPEGHPGLIVVATQVVEAGLDLSAGALWSEVAPWASVIQRLGRLNRDDKQPNATARFWMPKLTDSENGKNSPNVGRNGPYEKSALKEAEKLITTVAAHQQRGDRYRAALDAVLATEVSQQALRIATPVVVRADDVHGLFSTEPDLAGGFTNVAPFVRTAEAGSDVTVYWREFKDTPPSDLEEPAAEETVQVPVHFFSHFLDTTKLTAHLWDEHAGDWQRIRAWEVVPGMTLLLPASAGGYSDERGWTGNATDKPTVPTVQRSRRSSFFAERENDVGWQTLSLHTATMEIAAAQLGAALDLPPQRQAALKAAAKWHDVGKAHRRWQQPLLSHAPAGQSGPWAKFKDVAAFRPGVRHEVFSLLAAWERWQARDNNLTALVLYLIASHHGKVRTVLRSVGEGDNLFGWRADDEPLPLAGHTACKLDLSVRNFAGGGAMDWSTKLYTPERPSWNAIVDELLGPSWRGDLVTQLAVPNNEPRQLGPFQLAYLEALLRAADARASRGEFSLGEA